MTLSKRPHSSQRGHSRQLIFAPLAWLKLQFFCHAGNTEIGGFGITAKHNLLYVEDFVTVRQQTSMMTVAMDDDAIADYADRCVDASIHPQNFLRVWCHTHPGSSAEPSGVEEDTFARVFGACDWAVMFILSRASRTTARLSFHVGPRASVQLPVNVDWADWPPTLAQPGFSMPNLIADWQAELAANIHPRHDAVPPVNLADSLTATGSPGEPFAESWDWTDLDQQLWEEYERHERTLNNDHGP